MQKLMSSVDVFSLPSLLAQGYLACSNTAERFAFILIGSLSFLVSYALIYGTLNVITDFVIKLF